MFFTLWMLGLVVPASAQTGLPAVRINYEGELSKGQPVDASFVLEYADTETGNTKKESFLCTVKTRGATSISYDKKSLAVDLKDAEGKDLNANLLGLRKGNNKWILDAVACDRSGLRDRIAMDLFASYSKLPYSTDYNGRYSTVGSYVELWMNDAYQGFYSLSDKINRKLLGIEKEKKGKVAGVLYKCSAHGPWSFFQPYESKPAGTEDEWNHWELSYPNNPSVEAWEPLLSIFDTPWADISDNEYLDAVCQHFYWDNLVDVYLLSMITRAGDFGFKDCYLACANFNSDQRFIVVPWDLDTTFGSTWNGIYWKQLTTLRGISNFQFAHPYKRLIENPDFGFFSAVAKRWLELKDNALSVEAVSQLIHNYASRLDNSEAWQRNRELWNYAPISLDATAKEPAEWIADWYAANYQRVDELLKPFMPDGIEGIKASVPSDDNYYDLKGFKVNPSTMTKGIYIHHHKTIVR